MADVVYGEYLPNGKIRVYVVREATDTIEDLPLEYVKAMRRGTNVNFLAGDERFETLREDSRPVVPPTAAASEAGAGDGEDEPPRPRRGRPKSVPAH